MVRCGTFFRILSARYLPLDLWRAILTREKVPVPAQQICANGEVRAVSTAAAGGGGLRIARWWDCMLRT